jgi:hypothetical protein
MGEEAVMDAGEEISIVFAAFLGAEEGLTVEGFGLAEVALFLTEIGEDADLLDEAADAARDRDTPEPTRLLDTAGGGSNLALKSGSIHA